MVMKLPAWLQGLMSESFFGICGIHENKRKNEKNIFCLDCCQSFCPHCLPTHHSHPILQVRRYVYQNVVRLDDLEKLIDCSFVQPYTINSAKVIFLNQRAQNRSYKGSVNSCLTCDRILQEPFHFCSLSCKVDHMMYQGEDLSSVLCRFDVTHFAYSQFEGFPMDGSEFADDDSPITPNFIYEDSLQFKDSSSSDNGIGVSKIAYKPDGERKKKKNNDFLPKFFSFGSRRKGAPQRSPLS
ncbi:PLATZ transcription factor family protein [Artemisia annua]|uniref:PLATZ transcription factor family protein n=1 Tax=Artemisia annua TaxID=35608 RepID=A0A2U1P2G6_ARTAN|nr:PLATZ transcription factor family protein [Artemisia annua]